MVLATAGACYFYKIPQRIFTPQPSKPEAISPETIPPGYEIYKHKIYGYDMLSSETPILEVIVFDDQNENGVMDSNEKDLPGIHLDQYWNDELFGGSMTGPKNGVVTFSVFPLYQKITFSLPTRDGKYWGWRTVLEEGWPVTTPDKYEFILTEVPEETKIIYFGLKKTEEPAIPLIEEKPTQACVEVIKNGDPSSKINVVFISDKYSDDEMDLFRSDVDKFIDKEGTHRGLLSIEPFKSYQSHFNFYRIDKPYKFGCEEWTYGLVKEGVCSVSGIRSVAKMECPNLDELVVLLNHYKKGSQFNWAASHFSVIQRAHNSYIEKPLGYEKYEFSAPASFVHEFGHSFGDLADEYSNMGTGSRLDRANCDIKGCPEWCSGEIDTSKPCYQLIVEFENCVDSGKSSEECHEREPGGSVMEACDIGVNCLEGTGCVWNCKGTDGYKPSNPSGPDRPYGWKEIPCKMLSPEQDVFCPVCQRHLIDVIENYKK